MEGSDLPLPETPVTYVKSPRGISAVTLRRLWARALTMRRSAFFPRAFLRAGIGSWRLPESHGPADRLFGSAMISARACSCATMSSSVDAGAGPHRSTTWSALA